MSIIIIAISYLIGSLIGIGLVSIIMMPELRPWNMIMNKIDTNRRNKIREKEIEQWENVKIVKGYEYE